MNRLMQVLLALGVMLVTPAFASKPMVSIIMDDMGYRLDQDRRALSLSGAITYSILPNTPGASYVLQAAKDGGNEVMLHLPMESGSPSYYSAPGTLTRSMDWTTFVRTVQSNLAAVPGIVAVNNHEGSRLTADYQRMQWLMTELSRHQGIAFIDSRTTRHTVALKAAREAGLAATRRDIFLDYAPGKIAEQFNKLIQRAKREGSVLAIAHPRKETLDFLSNNLGRLKQMGVALVPISQLLALRQKTIAITERQDG